MSRRAAPYQGLRPSQLGASSRRGARDGRHPDHTSSLSRGASPASPPNCILEAARTQGPGIAAGPGQTEGEARGGHRVLGVGVGDSVLPVPPGRWSQAPLPTQLPRERRAAHWGPAPSVVLIATPVRCGLLPTPLLPRWAPSPGSLPGSLDHCQPALLCGTPILGPAPPGPELSRIS